MEQGRGFALLRRAAGLTQAQLAELFGVAITAIWRIERGDSPCRPFYILALKQLIARRKATGNMRHYRFMARYHAA